MAEIGSAFCMEVIDNARVREILAVSAQYKSFCKAEGYGSTA